MRASIPICFREGYPPFVPATLHWHAIESRVTVNLVVDTGAFDIVLSDEDVSTLGVDIDRLRPSKTPIGGVGGTVPSYDLHGVSVSFTCDLGKTHAFGLRTLRVMETRRLPGVKKEGGLSLLGRRFLQDSGFSLYWNFGRERARLSVQDRSDQDLRRDFIPWETAYEASEQGQDHHPRHRCV